MSPLSSARIIIFLVRVGTCQLIKTKLLYLIKVFLAYRRITWGVILIGDDLDDNDDCRLANGPVASSRAIKAVPCIFHETIYLKLTCEIFKVVFTLLVAVATVIFPLPFCDSDGRIHHGKQIQKRFLELSFMKMYTAMNQN